MLAFAVILLFLPGIGESRKELLHTVSVGSEVVIDIDIPEGDLVVRAGRAGVIEVSATANSSEQRDMANRSKSELSNSLTLDRTGNVIRFRGDPLVSQGQSDIVYTIEAPLETQLLCKLRKGKLTVIGLQGPIQAEVTTGNIDIVHVAKSVTVAIDFGDVGIDAVGGTVRARTGSGNIKISRSPADVTAETRDGDIALFVVGAASASVQSGRGRIEVGGSRGALHLTTDEGQIQVKARPYADWRITSVAGDIRVELPADPQCEIDAASKSGKVSAQRKDFESVASGNREIRSKLSGGGKTLLLRTDLGNIIIR